MSAPQFKNDKHYQGAPCNRGHSGERYISNGVCVMCEIARKAAYRAAHREQAKTYTAAWTAAHREQKKARSAAWTAAHREQHKATAAAWKAAHPEQRKATTAAYNAAHREEVRARNAAWKKDNPGAVRAIHANRRAMKISQHCVCCSNEDIQKVYDIASLCGPGAEVDHIVQLSLGGPHCAKNLIALTYDDHKAKTKLDAAERAESRRRNSLLRNWAKAAPVPGARVTT